MPFIKSLFQAILTQDVIMQGRFYVAAGFGQELNNPNIADVLANTLPASQKYPCVLLLPPLIRGNFQYTDPSEFGVMDMQLIFVTRAHVTGAGQIANPDPNNLSQHTVMETWHDMMRCAKDFFRVLYQGILTQPGYSNQLWISEHSVPTLYPGTDIAGDKATGAVLKFQMGFAIGCDIEAYEGGYMTSISWPSISDTHPLHTDV